MTAQEMTKNIETLASTIGDTREAVMARLLKKDHWTWFLLGEIERGNTKGVERVK